jgi:hypothetical protein
MPPPLSRKAVTVATAARFELPRSPVTAVRWAVSGAAAPLSLVITCRNAGTQVSSNIHKEARETVSRNRVSHASPVGEGDAALAAGGGHNHHLTGVAGLRWGCQSAAHQSSHSPRYLICTSQACAVTQIRRPPPHRPLPPPSRPTRRARSASKVLLREHGRAPAAASRP